MSFMHLLSEKMRKKLERIHDYYLEQSLKFRRMSDVSLAATARYFMTQMERTKRWSPDDPNGHLIVYDDVFIHCVVPELLARFESQRGIVYENPKLPTPEELVERMS